jgi:hypothetical protein
MIVPCRDRRGEVFSAGLTTVERIGSGWMVYHSSYERLARGYDLLSRAGGSDCYLDFREDVAGLVDQGDALGFHVPRAWSGVAASRGRAFGTIKMR